MIKCLTPVILTAFLCGCGVDFNKTYREDSEITIIERNGIPLLYVNNISSDEIREGMSFSIITQNLNPKKKEVNKENLEKNSEQYILDSEGWEKQIKIDVSGKKITSVSASGVFGVVFEISEESAIEVEPAAGGDAAR